MKFIHKPIPIVVFTLSLAFGFAPESRAAYLEPDTETPRPIDRAGDNHWILIREKDRPIVAEVTVHNEFRYYVFLMAGELLLGDRLERMAMTWDNLIIHVTLFGKYRYEDVTPMPKPYPDLPVFKNDDAIWR